MAQVYITRVVAEDIRLDFNTLASTARHHLQKFSGEQLQAVVILFHGQEKLVKRRIGLDNCGYYKKFWLLKGIKMVEPRREFYFQWHLTDKCNLQCQHCYQDNNNLELNLTEKLKIVEVITQALRKWGMKGRVSLTGGEPFLDKDLYSVLSALESQPEIGQINILSNGTLITTSLTQRLHEFKKIKEVQISLDGARQGTHDKIRGEGSFSRTLNGIDLLLEKGTAVTIMFTLWKENIAEVPALVDLVIEKKINAFTVERLVPCGNGRQLKDKILAPNELKKVYEYINERAECESFMSSGVRVRRSRPLWINTCGDVEEGASKGIGGFCPIGLSALAILPDGTVLPCRRLEIPLGNILTDGLYKIWYTSELLWRVRNKNNLKGKCNGCSNMPYCGGCRAIAYYLTGDYMGEDVQCWK
ncbi:MAG TPA: radical SAM protein [Desulfotomaculum sp.]|nr:MAG: hypothetical protein JL56_07890 [Desulfotomaculum sp. BICA1-6]HBX23302.1 radical SAM protein [Desulfotomaculum sp.]